MREILFRGGWIKNGEWIEGYYVFLNDTHYILEAGSEDWGANGEWFQVVPKSVVQYTGLKDKNGKKIFEGDIIRYQRGIDKFELMIVVWNESTASFVLAYSKDMYYYETLMNTKYYCEVIGNIYNNRELIG